MQVASPGNVRADSIVERERESVYITSMKKESHGIVKPVDFDLFTT